MVSVDLFLFNVKWDTGTGTGVFNTLSSNSLAGTSATGVFNRLSSNLLAGTLSPLIGEILFNDVNGMGKPILLKPDDLPIFVFLIVRLSCESCGVENPVGWLSPVFGHVSFVCPMHLHREHFRFDRILLGSV